MSATLYRILDSGTLVTCANGVHHLHNLEHRPDTEYRCPRDHSKNWAATIAEAERLAGRPRNPCPCDFSTVEVP